MEVDYHDVRMDAIASAAGVAKPTLYRYFDTKEALFFAAVEQSLTDLATDIERLCVGAAETCLRQAIGLVFERIGRLAPALRAIEAQGAAFKERRRDTLRVGFRRLREKITDLLDRGVEQDEFNAIDTELAAFAIVGASKRKGADLVGDLILQGMLRPRPAHQNDTSKLDFTAGAMA
jgi:TetR/AcrR family transcriptional repressor of mexJK operon